MYEWPRRRRRHLNPDCSVLWWSESLKGWVCEPRQQPQIILIALGLVVVLLLCIDVFTRRMQMSQEAKLTAAVMANTTAVNNAIAHGAGGQTPDAVVSAAADQLAADAARLDAAFPPTP